MTQDDCVPVRDHVVVGIDPGLDGGLAYMTTNGIICKAIPMPFIGKKGSRRRLDIRGFCAWLNIDVRGVYDIIHMCVIEQVHSMPKQGVVSVGTFMEAYGMLQGALAAEGVPTIRVTPQAWKKQVLAGTKKDKCAAIEYCQLRYPTVELVLKGCRTAHDGMADALCIAEYGRQIVALGKRNEYLQKSDG